MRLSDSVPTREDLALEAELARYARSETVDLSQLPLGLIVKILQHSAGESGFRGWTTTETLADGSYVGKVGIFVVTGPLYLYLGTVGPNKEKWFFSNGTGFPDYFRLDPDTTVPRSPDPDDYAPAYKTRRVQFGNQAVNTPAPPAGGSSRAWQMHRVDQNGSPAVQVYLIVNYTDAGEVDSIWFWGAGGEIDTNRHLIEGGSERLWFKTVGGLPAGPLYLAGSTLV